MVAKKAGPTGKRALRWTSWLADVITIVPIVLSVAAAVASILDGWAPARGGYIFALAAIAFACATGVLWLARHLASARRTIRSLQAALLSRDTDFTVAWAAMGIDDDSDTGASEWLPDPTDPLSFCLNADELDRCLANALPIAKDLLTNDAVLSLKAIIIRLEIDGMSLPGTPWVVVWASSEICQQVALVVFKGSVSNVVPQKFRSTNPGYERPRAPLRPWKDDPDFQELVRESWLRAQKKGGMVLFPLPRELSGPGGLWRVRCDPPNGDPPTTYGLDKDGTLTAM